MRRLTPLALAVCFGFGACSKSAGTKEKPDEAIGTERVAVPGGKGGVTVDTKADEARFRLQPEEGSLAIEAPAGAKAGAEAIAKIVIKPSDKYKVATEYPIKLELQTPTGMTIAKATLKAGGQDKEKGDAEVFGESGLAFAVKLTPSASGNYTINGSFKFAVCDRAGSTCLAKKESIAIQVAAQ